MAWIVVRCCAASIALALAGGVALAQPPQTSSRSNQTRATGDQYNSRIVSQLVQLADQARASSNLAFAIRAQSQAAALLWAQNPDQARLIYKRAFESLASGASAKSTEQVSRKPDGPASNASMPASEKRQLRTELLNQITARDPELAEELAREMSTSSEVKSDCGDAVSDCHSVTEAAANSPSGSITPRSREGSERRELLMSAALQIVERDPQQAMAFAQMSVALGISPNLSSLLALLRNVDHERADLLFANAMERLQQSSSASLSDIHTLGTYIVSASNSSAKEPFSRTLAVRFLNFAITQIGRSASSPLKSAGSDESPTLYFIGRQLADLSSRYAADRLGHVEQYLSDGNDSLAYEQAIDPDLFHVSAPAEIARQAREATDETQRDSLYARAAIAWLTEGNAREAQTTALKIAAESIRDRVLIQISRRYVSEKNIADGLDVAARITDLASRVDILVLLSNAALASRDKGRAAELLNEAETLLNKVSPSAERAQGFIKIACAFAAIDTLRSFEVLESAVRAINEIIKGDSKDGRNGIPSRGAFAEAFTLDELCSAGFENALTALAQADFDRALTLAQQLAGDEAPVIAQLAVLRGGLADRPIPEDTTGDDGLDSGVNH